MAFSAGIKKQLYHKPYFFNYPRAGWGANCFWTDVGLEAGLVQGVFLLWAWIYTKLENVTCLRRKASRPVCVLRKDKGYTVFLFRQKLIWKNELA